MDVSKSREIRAQLAMYIALARSQNLVCDQVGIVMPWSRDPPVMMYDVGKWKSDHLLEPAVVCAEKVKLEPSHRIKWTSLLHQFNVGSHVQKESALDLIKTNYPTKTPFQIFLYGNNPSADREQKGKAEMAKQCKPGVFGDYNAFVHAPYNLNLALEEDYVVESSKMYLRDSAQYGFKGVIFHVGHYSNKEQGVEIMYQNLIKILENASPETPFILETPCGNNNELLSSPEEFGEFILRFPEQLLGVCLDTCHVFVSGCMPMEYISRLGDASDRICLFHFNGSRKKQGCCADGHGHVTRIQNIPDEELIGVLEIAKKWEVCSVTE